MSKIKDPIPYIPDVPDEVKNAKEEKNWLFLLALEFFKLLDYWAGVNVQKGESRLALELKNALQTEN